jgi:Protein of unknown function (DUF3168)
MIGPVLYSVLSDASAITAIVGVNGIWPVVLPTDTAMPAIVYRVIGARTSPTNDTFGNTRYRVEIDSYATDWDTALELRAAVISSLNGYVDENMNIQLLQPIDDFDPDLLQYRAMAEFYLFSDL